MNKNFLINLTIFAGLFLVVWLVLWPTWAGISAARSEISAKQDTVGLEKQVVEKLNSINQVLDTQKTNVERLEQAIPTVESRPEILSIMENLASQNGLSMSGVSIDAPSEDTVAARGGRAAAVATSLKKVSVSAKVTGTYGSFKNWLNAVEKNLRITDVTKISFSISEKKTSEGGIEPMINPSIDYSVNMFAYVIKK